MTIVINTYRHRVWADAMSYTDVWWGEPDSTGLHLNLYVYINIDVYLYNAHTDDTNTFNMG